MNEYEVFMPGAITSVVADTVVLETPKVVRFLKKDAQGNNQTVAYFGECLGWAIIATEKE